MNVILFVFVLGTTLFILLNIFMYFMDKKEPCNDYILTFGDKTLIYCIIMLATFIIVASLYQRNKTYYEGERYSIVGDEFVSYRRMPHVMYDMNGKVEMEPIEDCEIKYIEGEPYIQFMDSKWLFLEKKRDSTILNLKKNKKE